MSTFAPIPFRSCKFWCFVYVQVFLKELERQKLQDTLHKDVMRKIIFLQRWFRARLQRKEFLDMRQAAILIQVNTDTAIIFGVLCQCIKFMCCVPILTFR